ncbi:hypothetical protein SLEP1_g26116 [Rubroshorea leprosula]|uniref:Uncharacterized protein n=1 Tax=Rubroshorea leprosula TaxID=152421 RepID=A0AAV5JL72_9ROSI|nr:hypothetical protein SLEP1_g26116 [Rubroshorea leprosula]
MMRISGLFPPRELPLQFPSAPSNPPALVCLLKIPGM